MGDNFASSDEDEPVRVGASTMAGAGDDSDFEDSEDDMISSRPRDAPPHARLAGGMRGAPPAQHVASGQMLGASQRVARPAMVGASAGAPAAADATALRANDPKENMAVKRTFMYTFEGSLEDLESQKVAPYLTCPDIADFLGDDKITVYDVTIGSVHSTAPVSFTMIPDCVDNLKMHASVVGSGGAMGVFTVLPGANQVLAGSPRVMSGAGETADSSVWLYEYHPGINMKNFTEGVHAAHFRSGVSTVATTHPVITVLRAMEPEVAIPAGPSQDLATEQVDEILGAIKGLLEGKADDTDVTTPHVTNLKDLRFKIVRAIGEKVLGGAPSYTDDAQIRVSVASDEAADRRKAAPFTTSVEVTFEMRAQ